MRTRAFSFIFVVLIVATFSWARNDTAGPAKPNAGAAVSSVAAARKSGSDEARASRYFESIRNQPLLLAAFLRRMPKGADLHSHLSGAVYAESYIGWAAQDGLCVDRKLLAFTAPPCEGDKAPASVALADSTLYYSLIRAFSVLGMTPLEAGHDHFFNAFAKFGAASRMHAGEMLAEVANRAAGQNIAYLELMYSPASSSALASQLKWDNDLGALRASVPPEATGNVVSAARKTLDDAEAQMKALLGCGTPQAQPGCNVQVRYLYQGYRAGTREQVFASLVAAFEVAKADPRFVGVNFVQAEDSYSAMRDFDLHMRMFDYFHEQYPAVHISLHAGELAPGLVPPEGLRNHIRESVERGHAERIGHGVDVAYEREPLELLQQMAKRNVLVEICLSSNDYILEVRGNRHPLPLYLQYGVPVALATDDEGVSRSDLSREFQRAVESYQLKYGDVKRLARMSLEHSFLPGDSLWMKSHPAPPCASDHLGVEKPSRSCAAFLDKSERARLQWRLERQFADFEASY